MVFAPIAVVGTSAIKAAQGRCAANMALDQNNGPAWRGVIFASRAVKAPASSLNGFVLVDPAHVGGKAFCVVLCSFVSVELHCSVLYFLRSMMMKLSGVSVLSMK